MSQSVAQAIGRPHIADAGRLLLDAEDGGAFRVGHGVEMPEDENLSVGVREHVDLLADQGVADLVRQDGLRRPDFAERRRPVAFDYGL